MARVKGYSLWLMPEGDVYNRLKELMSGLGEKYKSPIFEPHVTLTGQVLGTEEEIVALTAGLAGNIKSFDIRLGGVACLDEYFRALFLKADETDEAINANLIARTVFNRESNPPYMPHLSLMYGDFSISTKKEIISSLGNKFDIAFEARSIHIYSTKGVPEEWSRVKAFPLAK